VPLVLAPVPEAARAVIERYAAQAGAPVVHAADIVDVELASNDARGQRLIVRTERGSFQLTMPVLGAFQRANAATAIAVLECAGERLRPSAEAIASGFAQLEIAGRMEVLSRNPAVVFDVAHNVEKASSLVLSLRERFGDRRVHYVVAIGESKDARRILEVLGELPSTFTFTSFAAQGRRPIPPVRLAAMAESLGRWGRAIADPVEAFSVARRLAALDDVIVVTGSTFVVAGVREWYAPTPA